MRVPSLFASVLHAASSAFNSTVLVGRTAVPLTLLRFLAIGALPLISWDDARIVLSLREPSQTWLAQRAFLWLAAKIESQSFYSS